MKRLLSLTLALLMCLSPCFIFAGCASEPEEPEHLVPPKNDWPGSEQNNGQNGLYPDDLPALDFQNKTVNVLYWSDNALHEFGEETVQGDTLNDAVLLRNQTVEKRLNIKLNLIAEPGNNVRRASFYKRVLYAKSNGSHEFDLIAAYPCTQAMLSYVIF